MKVSLNCGGFAGTRVRVKPKVQGRQIHHRAGAYDQGERMGMIDAPAVISRRRRAMNNRVQALPPPPETLATTKREASPLARAAGVCTIGIVIT